jgi:subtilisin family serine protease
VNPHDFTSYVERTAMARSRPRNSRSQHHESLNLPISAGETETHGQFTGKYLVLLRDNGAKEGIQALKDAAGLSDVCNAGDYKSAAIEMSDAGKAEVLLLDKLKVAVVDADPSQVGGLRAAAAEESAILAIEPERMMYALSPALDPAASSFSIEYLKGYKDAVNHLYAVFAGTQEEKEAGPEAAAAGFADNSQFTWGLQATRVSQSQYSGKDIRVAVLDTGVDLGHPDFVGRQIISQSFIPGQAVNDLNGHGTHCIGTCLGPQQPAGGVRRYGCAYRADIFAGKVLNNQGQGADSGILAGINWAITNKCRVISMSLGAPAQPGEPFSTIYENVAQRALQSDPGTVIVAAAGNESRNPMTGARLDPPRPVGRPANCPSVLSVAALDANLRVAPFSNGGINANGGGVDIAGPGVAVFSSVPEPFPATVQPGGPGRPWPSRYHVISGTSMATPHVAGIAAMWLEAQGPGSSARVVWQLLTGNARRLMLPNRDVGSGLVQAPI